MFFKFFKAISIDFQSISSDLRLKAAMTLPFWYHLSDEMLTVERFFLFLSIYVYLLIQFPNLVECCLVWTLTYCRALFIGTRNCWCRLRLWSTRNTNRSHHVNSSFFVCVLFSLFSLIKHRDMHQSPRIERFPFSSANLCLFSIPQHRRFELWSYTNMDPTRTNGPAILISKKKKNRP